MAQTDTALLEAALRGYQAQIDRITKAIAEIKRRLRAAGGPGLPATTMGQVAKPRKKHRVSAAGRKRIAEAQRKRWAAQKKHNG